MVVGESRAFSEVGEVFCPAALAFMMDSIFCRRVSEVKGLIRYWSTPISWAAVRFSTLDSEVTMIKGMDLKIGSERTQLRRSRPLMPFMYQSDMMSW